ncbi:MAG: sulfurtransferase TusA family protein [Rhodobacteraceae bacterium]|nr:sulfurtransferase TusA family protein [Paracoccaceae bacterium]MCY4196914.1 sulfurtransferase TusA family protein [Paracoccaceae bacterium]
MTKQLDATGLQCPLPVLRIRKFLQGLESGDRLTVIADDPVAAIDVPHFCSEQGHALIAVSEIESGIRFEIQKK